MEMRAAEEIEMGEDLTPELTPLACALYDEFLFSHCTDCFSSFSSALCCSPSSSTLSFAASPPLLSSDIRAAFRLLSFIEDYSPDRIGGLLTNRDILMNSSISSSIQEAAAALRRARGGVSNPERLVMEESALCAVLTNAVEVTDENSRALGIAVYDTAFSWINHSCSPNACYRFSITSSTSNLRTGRTRIVPHDMKNSYQENRDCKSFAYRKDRGRSWRNGPRIVVRSIKRIKQGEEVTVSYTDILQPKALRQSDLWTKYQFVCRCGRCSSSPPIWADSVLDGVMPLEVDASGVKSYDARGREEANDQMRDFLEGAVDEYLSDFNPELCCRKIECLLCDGLPNNFVDKGKLHVPYKLHPFHHAALNAYTTLASAYRVRSRYLSTHSGTTANQRKALDMTRISAAYSLMLAAGTHQLFLSESSLIVSAANFWMNAGENLLFLARSPEWHGLAEQEGVSILELPSLPDPRCNSCCLLDMFWSVCSHIEFQLQGVTESFQVCMANYKPKETWRFLAHGCKYLETFETPIDFNERSFKLSLGNRGGDIEKGKNIYSETRIDLHRMALHCLLYGGVLAGVCYGRDSQIASQVKKLMQLNAWFNT